MVYPLFDLIKLQEFIMQIRDKIILYAVTDRRWLNGRTLYECVEAALKGGASIIQLREKEISDEEFLQEALDIKTLCHKYNAPLIINDRIEVALKADADGVHIGQHDESLSNARHIFGSDKIIGVSAHNVDEALKAQNAGANYLGVGAAFATGTKGDANVIKHGTIADICHSVDIPVVAIGGVTKDNITELTGSGISGAAVVSSLFANDDIEKAAKELYFAISKAVKI